MNNNDYIKKKILIYTGGHLAVEEQDPLPNEDVSVTDENISNNAVNSEFITISVTNELGEKIKGQLPNGYV